MLKIVRAEKKDAQEITDIKIAAYNKEINLHLGRDGGPPGYNQVSSQLYIIDNFIAYKILEDEKIIGCFFLEQVSDEHMHFEDFCIYPLSQNKGYGYKTLELLEKTYPQIKKWTLNAARFSKKNQYLYEKFGYKKIGETEWEYEYEKVLGI
ncbi:MAG: GNAT family N-acetyltransferase [Ruminiclostridium sp.]|nr:GNAT family N-acetyltransferase [Ruminiclostridium sp.]